ncbi:hypothetical protein [Marisediminicola sp. LYQ85]|uniref:hypothetical protein n=1 Tax=Marisediminicola sp. LYQ85 TaxID=3391062 RepID=UPI0039835FAC
MSEFDDKRPEDGPPPLVPPPVRSNDSTATTNDTTSTDATPASSDTPLFVEPGDTPAPATDDAPARDTTADDSAAQDAAATDAAAHDSAVNQTAANEAAVTETAAYDTTAYDESATTAATASAPEATPVSETTPVSAATPPPVAVPVAASAPAPVARDQQPDYSAQPAAAQQPNPYAQQPNPYAQQPPQSNPYAQQQQQQPPQRSFIPPPVEPKKKGNRGLGSLIAVLSVVIFAAIYVAVTMLIVAVTAPQQSVTEALTLFLVEPLFYVPVLFFVVGFVIVVLLVNRASWWAFVLGSLFVGALVYFGTIGVQLLLDNVLEDTPAQASARFVGYAVNPYVIAAGLVAREVSMWIGAAISSRGRRVKAKNIEARNEYERAAAQHRAEYERGYASA